MTEGRGGIVEKGKDERGLMILVTGRRFGFLVPIFVRLSEGCIQATAEAIPGRRYFENHVWTWGAGWFPAAVIVGSSAKSCAGGKRGERMFPEPVRSPFRAARLAPVIRGGKPTPEPPSATRLTLFLLADVYVETRPCGDRCRPPLGRLFFLSKQKGPSSERSLSHSTASWQRIIPRRAPDCC